MRLEVYHQLGFRHNWNFECLATDGAGDGVILAPRFLKKAAVEDLPPSDRAISIFDPQFFLPATPRGELASYDFFPDVVSEAGFDSSEFASHDGLRDPTPSAAARSAEGCVGFQVRQGFPYVVIPTRYVRGAPGDFIERQSELFVEPFLKALDAYPGAKAVLLQLVLNDLMLKEEEYLADILNWVTGLPRVTGAYLIVESFPRGKQLRDPVLLHAMLKLIGVLSQNGMDVVVGYTNTEAILLSIAGPKIVTVGCYETTRMFNVNNFEEKAKSEPKTPTPRIYVPRLLQWIDHNYIPFINRLIGKESPAFFGQNRYLAEMLRPGYQWNASRSELYKHAIVEEWRQLRELGNLDGRDRYLKVTQFLTEARQWFARFSDLGLELPPESDGSHLPAWITVANAFAHDKGWRF